MKKLTKLFSSLSVAPILGTTFTLIGYQQQKETIDQNENILLGEQSIKDQWQLNESQLNTDATSLMRHEWSPYGNITSINKFISATYSKNKGSNYTYVVDLNVKRNNLNSTHDFLFNETVNLQNKTISYSDFGTPFSFKLPTISGIPGMDHIYDDSLSNLILTPNDYSVLKNILNDYYNRDISHSDNPTDKALMPFEDGSGKSIDHDSTAFKYIGLVGNTYHVLVSMQWYLTSTVGFQPKLSELLTFDAYINLNLKDPSIANNGVVTIPGLFNMNAPIASLSTIPPYPLIEKTQKMETDLSTMMIFDYWSTFNTYNSSGLVSLGGHMTLPKGELLIEVEYVNSVKFLSNKGNIYSFVVNLQPMETGAGLHKAININTNVNVDTMQFSFPSLGKSFNIKLNSNEVPGTKLDTITSFGKELEANKNADLYKMIDALVNVKLESTKSTSDYWDFRPIAKNPIIIDNSQTYSNYTSWFKDMGTWGNYESIEVSTYYKDLGDNVCGGTWFALYYNNLDNPKDSNNNTLTFPDLLNLNK